MLKPHCLVVLTTSATALPKMYWWWHDSPAPNIFGYTGRYFNPHRPLQCPNVYKDDLLGFYPVMETTGEEFVCEIASEQISLVLILAMEPGQAYAIYKKGGLTELKTQAIVTRRPNQHGWGLIKTIAA